MRIVFGQISTMRDVKKAREPKVSIAYESDINNEGCKAASEGAFTMTMSCQISTMRDVKHEGFS